MPVWVRVVSQRQSCIFSASNADAMWRDCLFWVYKPTAAESDSGHRLKQTMLGVWQRRGLFSLRWQKIPTWDKLSTIFLPGWNVHVGHYITEHIILKNDRCWLRWPWRSLPLFQIMSYIIAHAYFYFLWNIWIFINKYLCPNLILFHFASAQFTEWNVTQQVAPFHTLKRHEMADGWE